MPDLGNTRRKLTITIATLLLVDLAAAAMLLSPIVGSEKSRLSEMDRLWKELQVKTRQVEPLRGMDKKVALAQKQIDEFYQQRLTSQDSTISTELGKVAAQSGVKISEIRYKAKDPESIGLRPMEIEANLSGDYLQLVRFINALERDQLFFIIDSVQLGGEQGGTVKLQMKMETFLKGSA
jgi:type II secretion system (T2SS) protein M